VVPVMGVEGLLYFLYLNSRSIFICYTCWQWLGDAMKYTVKEFPVNIGAGMTCAGYAIICDNKMQHWTSDRGEANSLAESFERDANPIEDY